MPSSLATPFDISTNISSSHFSSLLVMFCYVLFCSRLVFSYPNNNSQKGGACDQSPTPNPTCSRVVHYVNSDAGYAGYANYADYGRKYNAQQFVFYATRAPFITSRAIRRPAFFARGRKPQTSKSCGIPGRQSLTESALSTSWLLAAPLPPHPVYPNLTSRTQTSR